MTPTLEYNKSPIPDAFSWTSWRRLVFDTDNLQLRCPRSGLPHHRQTRAMRHWTPGCITLRTCAGHNTVAACLSRLSRGIKHHVRSGVHPGSRPMVYVHEGPNGKPMAVDVSIATPLVAADPQRRLSPGWCLAAKLASSWFVAPQTARSYVMQQLSLMVLCLKRLAARPDSSRL